MSIRIQVSVGPRRFVTAALAGLALSCAAGPPRDARGPRAQPLRPREPGCVVELLREGIPTRAVQRVGTVRARCTGEIAADLPRCERLLLDEACRRGAHVLWEYTSTPMDDREDGIVLQASAGAYP